MKRVALSLALFSCLAAPALCEQPATATVQGRPTAYHVIYAGGSITDVQSGKKLPLTIAPDVITLGELTIPVNTITAIDLTQDKHHRIGTGIAVSMITLGAGIPIMLSKSTKDFISLTYKGGGVNFQADKNEYRGILAQLQGVTGLTAGMPPPAK